MVIINKIFIMKKNWLFFLCFTFLFISCSDDNDVNDNSGTNENPYKTGIDLSSSSSVEFNCEGIGNTYFMLGYGYDMTGKYAHPASVKNKIIDVDKYEASHSSRIIRENFYAGFGDHNFSGDVHQSVRSLSLNIGFTEDEIVKYKNLFKEVFVSPFKNDTSFIDLPYFYAGTSQLHTWYRAYMMNDYLGDYLTDEFKADLQTKSADDIIKLYGTHILKGVSIGERIDYLYRTTVSFNLNKLLLRNSHYYFSVGPLSFTDEPEKKLQEKENIYFEVIGGGVSNPNSWMVDVTNYSGERIVYDGWNKLTDSNLTLIGFDGINSKQLPIYEVVSDSVKKEELRKAYERYLSE